MPRDTIEAVLKSHGGNLQTATEALLLASGADQAQTVRLPNSDQTLLCLDHVVKCTNMQIGVVMMQSTSTGASPAAQVWRDEELARAMQVIS